MYYVQWNSELYITGTNDSFEELVGRVHSDLVGRRISTLPWLEEASRKQETGSVIIPVPGPDQKTRSVLWIFTDMFNEDSDIPFMTVGSGIEIPGK
jgi:PAS domain-containing protein